MIITALNTFAGRLDLASNQRLQDQNEIEALPFQLTMVPGQVETVDDKFYSLRSIQSAIASGYISVQPPHPIVHSFNDLDDVPASYVGQKNRLVKIKNDETGLDYTVRLTVGPIQPVTPSVFDLWLDTNP
jgi:hypothetical protein